MADKLSNFLLKDITSDPMLLEGYSTLLYDYSQFLIGHPVPSYSESYQRLLLYSDLLSLSEDESHHNLSQQIVILMSILFPDNSDVTMHKESVYKNVSNYASLAYLEKHHKLVGPEGDFLRELTFHAHRIENRIPYSNASFFDSQMALLEELGANKYYSFSAPTSMGKTFVLLSFIKSQIRNGTNENFAIVVPTRALLSEIANKIIVEFADVLGDGCHKVITTTAAVQNGEKFIAVLTPERLYYALLKQPDLLFSYIFIDEAHKITDKDKRSIIYYKILDMLRGKPGAHIYFSSPVIPNPDVFLELTNFYQQDDQVASGRVFKFSPVIQNKVYIDFVNNELSLINSITNDHISCGVLPSNCSSKMDAITFFGKEKCNLIYVSSANKAIDYAGELVRILDSHSLGNVTITPELEAAAKMIEQKIHKEYFLAKFVRHGVAYHIGALPAEIRATIEQLLRDGYIKYCFCTSTLLEGVNVPVDNLFVFDTKKGPSAMSTIDAFNLIGRAGRVTLNEYGNVFIIIEKTNTAKFFDDVLLKPLPTQTLLPQKALQRKHKVLIVNTLLAGKTNLLEANQKYKDRGFTEITYDYASKCLNMLLHDICRKNESYIVQDFRRNGVLTPQNIIDIRNLFANIVHEDDDINISAKQKDRLYRVVQKININYPPTFDYETCLDFLQTLSKIFQWDVYEKDSLGKGDSLKYYTVILTQWMEGRGLHEILRGAITHYQTHHGKLVSFDPVYHLESYDDSPKHKNQVINESMKDIEQIINYKFSMYFLRFSEAIIAIKGKEALVHDWYDYVEYGTNNEMVIMLQKYGFLREQALSLLKAPYSEYIERSENGLIIHCGIFDVAEQDITEAIKTVRINYPEIFV